MKFKQLGDYNGNVIETILKNRGIENIDLFLNPTSNDNTILENITNIDKGIELIEKHIDDEIIILVDSDCDGITSSSILYQSIKFINPNAKIDFYIHKHKAHGLTSQFLEYINNNNFKLVIVPDAGSNDIEEIEKIVDIYGADILIIDHHQIEKFTDKGVIINNQTCESTNKNLTGAGLSYLFCKALEQKYKTGRIEELADLAMLGLVGDSANLAENEVRYICTSAIKNISNPLIKALYEEQKKDIDKLIIKDLSFGGIIPLINSIIRIGTLEEKFLLFETISNINVDYTKQVTKRKLNKETRKYEEKDFILDAYQYTIEVCNKSKSKQDALTKKITESLAKQYNPSVGVQVFILDNEDGKAITGLLANKLSGKYQQPVIVMWLNEKDNNYIGSLRGNIKVLQNFKEWCIKTELFDLVQGHPNASGIILKAENKDKLIEKTKRVTAEEFCYDVDVIYKNAANIEHIKEVDRKRELWYGGCEEPLFAVENLEIAKQNIVLNKSVLKFYHNGISYIKYRSNETEYNELAMTGFDSKIVFNIVGKFEINRYNGREYPQVVIEDYEVIETAPNIYGIFA